MEFYCGQLLLQLLIQIVPFSLTDKYVTCFSLGEIKLPLTVYLTDNAKVQHGMFPNDYTSIFGNWKFKICK